MNDEIQFALSPPIATITLNRPEDRNRLMLANLRRLEEIVAQLHAAADIHCVIVTGTGDEFFSAGLLNPDLRAALGKDEVLEIVFLANRIFDAIDYRFGSAPGSGRVA